MFSRIACAALLALFALSAAPAAAQSDPCGPDLYGYGPAPGAPTFYYPPDANNPFYRCSSVSSFSLIPGQLWGIGAMTRQTIMGLSLWRSEGAPCYVWQTEMPDGNTPRDRVLYYLIEDAGGALPFFLRWIDCASYNIAHWQNFLPDWGSAPFAGLNASVTVWRLQSVVPDMPSILVLPNPPPN